ncbi:DUF1800 domain-containing protein [Actinophytocola oryzae]|nr:DUF1800 domain-containing protein [Actinophytocola oryzae]
MGVLSEQAAVRRLWDRFGFGAAPGDLTRPFDETLDRLLGAPAGGGTAPPELPVTTKPPKDDQQARKTANKQRAAQEKQLAAWWLDRMVTTQGADVTAERMTWFWHGHFATSAQKVKVPALMLKQNQTFRQRGLGSFTDLARTLVVDPAMILWLDGDDNTTGAANENLAREFMELFSLGVGHYSETDVREAARALTGWTVNRATGATKLVPKRHDDGPEEILGERAQFSAESFVDHVLERPESAPFVVGRLWFRLVSSTPPDKDTLDGLVGAYGTNRDIRAVLRAVAGTSAFRDDRTTLVKQPVEWLAGLLRAAGLRPSTLDDGVSTKLYQGLVALGQVPFRPPSVGGWPAGAAFLTTAAGLTRLRIAQLVAKTADLSTVSGKDPVEAVRVLLSVDAFSDRTRAALGKVAANPAQVTALAACAPEYVVSG